MKLFIVLLGIISAGKSAPSQSSANGLEKLSEYYAKNIVSVLNSFPDIGYQYWFSAISIDYDESKVTSMVQGKEESPGQVVPDKSKPIYAIFDVNEASGNEQTITVSGKFSNNLYVTYEHNDKEVKNGCNYHTLVAAFFPFSGSAVAAVFSVATNSSDVVSDLSFDVDSVNIFGRPLNYAIKLKLSSKGKNYQAYVMYSLLTTDLNMISAGLILSDAHDSEKLKELTDFTCSLVSYKNST